MTGSSPGGWYDGGVAAAIKSLVVGVILLVIARWHWTHPGEFEFRERSDGFHRTNRKLVSALLYVFGVLCVGVGGRSLLLRLFGFAPWRQPSVTFSGGRPNSR